MVRYLQSLWAVDNILGALTANHGFKFPSLDPDTEKFLWRRKADLEMSLRQLDSISGNV